MKVIVDLHPDTKQRQIDSFSEPLDNTVNKVWLDENAQNLYVKWEDQSESCLSYGLTRNVWRLLLHLSQLLYNFLISGIVQVK